VGGGRSSQSANLDPLGFTAEKTFPEKGDYHGKFLCVPKKKRKTATWSGGGKLNGRENYYIMARGQPAKRRLLTQRGRGQFSKTHRLSRRTQGESSGGRLF